MERVKIIFCMFHGQSAVELGFNTNAKLAVKNQAGMSSLCMVHDHMRAKKTGSRNIEINKELRRSVGKPKQRYGKYLEEEKKNMNALQRKIQREKL